MAVEHRVVGSVEEECFADYWEAICDDEFCDWCTNTFTEQRAREHLASHQEMMHGD